MLYTKELVAAGATVRLVFDGAGTGWLARWGRSDGPASRAAELFAELKAAGLAYEVCDYCAGAFDVREELSDAGEALTGSYMDHPSVAGHVADGFQVWIL
ncbi:MAG: DsrE family protein [Chloroflexi bacterium]|nr:DsrE family protein [Chloroflexota bacterium]